MSSDSLAKLLVVLLSLNRNQLVGFFKHMIYKVIRIHLALSLLLFKLLSIIQSNKYKLWQNKV